MNPARLGTAADNVALDAALTRVGEIGFVIEDIVDPIHEEVVRDQKEEAAYHQQRIDVTRDKEVGGGEGKGGVDPADRPRRLENAHDHRLVSASVGAKRAHHVHSVGTSSTAPIAYARSSMGATGIRTPEMSDSS